MTAELVASTANPLIKRVRALAQRKHREAERAFVVEGIAPVWHAVEQHARIEALLVCDDLLTSEPARQVVAEQRRAGLRVVGVTRTVFESFADRENPSGLAAIVRMEAHQLAELEVRPESVLVALHEVGNPGNLGTIIRTLDAIDGAGLILIGDSTDPYHPTSVKASMGTLFSHPLVRIKTIEPLLEWQTRNAIQLVTTSAHAEQSYWEAKYRPPVLLLFGSEGEGLPRDLIARGDIAVRIPMEGVATSLNLAVSVGVLLYEVKRQRNLEEGTRR